MSAIKMSQEIKYDRRHFLGNAAMTVAAAQLGMIGGGRTISKINLAGVTSIKPGTSTSFGPLKQIDAGVLVLAMRKPVERYAAVILLHGCPTTFTAMSMSPFCWRRRVARRSSRLCAAMARRAFFQVKRFERPAIGRCSDITALMDALKIKGVIGGFDWGARTANIIGPSGRSAARPVSMVVI